MCTVAIYSLEDRLALHRFKADEAYQVGAGKGPVEERGAKLLTLEAMKMQSKIHAPIAGRISKLLVTPGSTSSPRIFWSPSLRERTRAHQARAVCFAAFLRNQRDLIV